MRPPATSTDGGVPTVDGGVVVDPIPPPVFPPWMPQPLVGDSQTPGGTQIAPTPSLGVEQFPYVPFTDVSLPQPPLAIGTPPPVKPPLLPPVIMTPEQQALAYHLADYRPLPPYPIEPGFAGLFAVPEDPAS